MAIVETWRATPLAAPDPDFPFLSAKIQGLRRQCSAFRLRLKNGTLGELVVHVRSARGKCSRFHVVQGCHQSASRGDMTSVALSFRISDHGLRSQPLANMREWLIGQQQIANCETGWSERLEKIFGCQGRQLVKFHSFFFFFSFFPLLVLRRGAR